MLENYLRSCWRLKAAAKYTLLTHITDDFLSVAQRGKVTCTGSHRKAGNEPPIYCPQQATAPCPLKVRIPLEGGKKKMKPYRPAQLQPACDYVALVKLSQHSCGQATCRFLSTGSQPSLLTLPEMLSSSSGVCIDNFSWACFQANSGLCCWILLLDY